MLNSFKIFIFFTLFYITSYSIIKAQEHTKPDKKADLIIFSFDRPLQLFALLESVQTNVTNLNHIYVLLRTSSQEYDAAYQQVKNAFPRIQFIEQGNNPRQDFKPLLLQGFFGSSAEFILFAVDDDIVKEVVDINECINAMQEKNAYCFFLRLGTNITQQYGQNISLLTPPCIEVKKNIFKYYINDGNYGDWRYPNNVDMTLYKKSNIEPFFVHGDYSSPNTLEANWAAQQNLHQYGLFFKTSKMFALPLNIVQQDWTTSNQGTFDSTKLLTLWQDGFIMDLSRFYGLNNSCAFVDQEPTFIAKK